MLPMESSRGMRPVTGTGRSQSPVLALWLAVALKCLSRHPTPSLAGLPRCPEISMNGPCPVSTYPGLSVALCMLLAVAGRRVDFKRTRNLGGEHSRVCSYGRPMTGVESDRLLIFRIVGRWDRVRWSDGIRTCIFLARRQNSLSCWPLDAEAGSSSGSWTTGIVYCTFEPSPTWTPGAPSLQYGRPPISGDEGLLASSHAFTSRSTPASGRCGRGGAFVFFWAGKRSMAINCGIGGIGGMGGAVVAVPVEGAVPGRPTGAGACNSISPPLLTCDAGCVGFR
jgi:hypothetical protein